MRFRGEYYMGWKIRGLPMKKPIFAYEIILIFQHNLLEVKCTSFNGLLKFLNFWNKTICQTLETGLRFRNNLLIGVKFYYLEPSFQIRKQIVIAGGQIWIRQWVRKQFISQIIQFHHRFYGSVRRCVVLMKHHFFSYLDSWNM